MILADDIMAAVGTENDLCDVLSSMAVCLKDAERFVLTDNVTTAAGELIRTKPSSLIEAMPLCRAPYKNVWIEWNGKLRPISEPIEDNRSIPNRMGCLVECQTPAGDCGSMTWAWSHAGQGIGFSGLSVYFDYAGNMKDRLKNTLAMGANNPAGQWTLNSIKATLAYQPSGNEITKAMDASLWQGFSNKPKEREAFMKLDNYEAVQLSRHAVNMLVTLFKNGTEHANILELYNTWMFDIAGESRFITAVLAMMNSRNAVEHEPVELDRLNRARARRGRTPFLSHHITHLHLSKARRHDAEASGMSRSEMRAHMVRGHFKIRRSGVYWWSPFVRGKGSFVRRERYEVHHD